MYFVFEDFFFFSDLQRFEACLLNDLASKFKKFSTLKNLQCKDFRRQDF